MDKRIKMFVCIIGIILGISIIIGTVIISKYNLGKNKFFDNQSFNINLNFFNNNVNDNIRFISKDEIPKLSSWYIVSIVTGALIFSLSLLYLIMDLSSKDRIAIFILVSIIFTTVISFGCIYITDNYILTSTKIVQDKLAINENFN